MTSNAKLPQNGLRRALLLTGLMLVLAVSVMQPTKAAWADDGKSDGGGGNDGGGNDGGGNDGGGNDGGGGDDSGGDGGGSDDGGSDDGGGDDSGGGDDDSNDDGDSNSGGKEGGKRSRSKLGAGDQDAALAASLKGKIASLREIVTLAQKMVPGEIVDIKLRRENTRVIYRIKIIQKNGALLILRIDAKTRRRVSGASP